MVTKATISNHPAPQEIPVLLQRSSVRAPGSPSSFVPWRLSNRNPLFLIDQKQIFFLFSQWNRFVTSTKTDFSLD
jgi:hypothetical protein